MYLSFPITSRPTPMQLHAQRIASYPNLEGGGKVVITPMDVCKKSKTPKPPKK